MYTQNMKNAVLSGNSTAESHLDEKLSQGNLMAASEPVTRFGGDTSQETESAWLSLALRFLSPMRSLSHLFNSIQLLSSKSLRLGEASVDTSSVEIHVGLLKVDVEGSELEVLEGLSPSQWQQIRQVVVEVHCTTESDKSSNRYLRLGKIESLLSRHGFQCRLVAHSFGTGARTSDSIDNDDEARDTPCQFMLYANRI